MSTHDLSKKQKKITFYIYFWVRTQWKNFRTHSEVSQSGSKDVE